MNVRRMPMSNLNDIFFTPAANQELTYALIRFETRIGSPMLSDVIRGLIGVLRGDDQRMYFKMITFDMRQIEQNNLKKEAAKRPKKIQRYSMMMLICIMIIYLVVLCTEVMSSLGAFFG